VREEEVHRRSTSNGPADLDTPCTPPGRTGLLGGSTNRTLAKMGSRSEKEHPDDKKGDGQAPNLQSESWQGASSPTTRNRLVGKRAHWPDRPGHEVAKLTFLEESKSTRARGSEPGRTEGGWGDSAKNDPALLKNTKNRGPFPSKKTRRRGSPR